MKNIFQLKKYYYFLFNSSGYYKNGTIIWLIMNTFIKKKKHYYKSYTTSNPKYIFKCHFIMIAMAWNYLIDYEHIWRLFFQLKG